MADTNKSVMQKHPNATAAVVGSYISTLLLYETARLGVELHPAEAGALTGLLITGILFLGRRLS